MRRAGHVERMGDRRGAYRFLVRRPDGKRQLENPRPRGEDNIKMDIPDVKYADDLILLAKEEKVLQDMIDKLIEIGRCYGMEMNVEKTNVMRI
jgi:hypothetical protein